jgi:tetratricopeptide (TPR) repeat protein
VSREALQLHPNHWIFFRELARALTALGDYKGALRYFRRASLLNEEHTFGFLTDIAYVHAVAGNRDEAVNLLARTRGKSGDCSLISIAMIHAALGNRHRALDYIEEACARRDWYVSGLKQDGRLDPLRTASQFRSVLVRVGI